LAPEGVKAFPRAAEEGAPPLAPIPLGPRRTRTPRSFAPKCGTSRVGSFPGPLVSPKTAKAASDKCGTPRFSLPKWRDCVKQTARSPRQEIDQRSCAQRKQPLIGSQALCQVAECEFGENTSTL